MRFETEFQCPKCGAAYIVYPAYPTVAKTVQRSLPAWKRCECAPRFEEITTAEFEALVPGWRDLMDPGDPSEVLEA
jgi:transcription elongation factor Elf1